MKPKKSSPVPKDAGVLSLREAMDEWNRRLAEAGERARKRKQQAVPYFTKNAFRRPQPSDALGVHPDQRAEAIQHAKDHGVPTDYTPGGRPIITSVGHQKRLAKIRGFVPRRGY